MSRIDLYIPGLLAAPSRLHRTLELPSAPSLAAFCKAAVRTPSSPGRFGFIADELAVSRAPVAALAWLGANGERPVAQVLLATPVHFEAGMDDLVLFAGSNLQVSREEQQALAHDLAEFFAPTPAVHASGENIFLVPPEPLAVRTTPLHRAQGQTVRPMLPEGEGARQLNAWLNEMHMFLHGHAINRDRSARGLLTLNGLWPWGEGELPEIATRQDVVMHAHSDIMRGLGRLLGEVREGTSLDDVFAGEGRQVLEVRDCIDALDADDAEGWYRAVARIDREVLAPVLEWQRSARNREAVLHGGDGCSRRLGETGMLEMLRRTLRSAERPVLVEEA